MDPDKINVKMKNNKDAQFILKNKQICKRMNYNPGNWTTS